MPVRHARRRRRTSTSLEALAPIPIQWWRAWHGKKQKARRRQTATIEKDNNHGWFLILREEEQTKTDKRRTDPLAVYCTNENQQQYHTHKEYRSYLVFFLGSCFLRARRKLAPCTVQTERKLHHHHTLQNVSLVKVKTNVVKHRHTH